jgi:hypothetical protein
MGVDLIVLQQLAVAFGLGLLLGAKEHFGSAGFYTVAIVSELTEMDAITLSSARLVESGRIDPSTGWRAILIAAMSNFVVQVRDGQLAWRPLIDVARQRGLRFDPCLWRRSPLVLACLSHVLIIDRRALTFSTHPLSSWCRCFRVLLHLGINKMHRDELP